MVPTERAVDTIGDSHIVARVPVDRDCERNGAEGILKTEVSENGCLEYRGICESGTNTDTKSIEELQTAGDRNVPIESISYQNAGVTFSETEVGFVVEEV